MGTNLGELPIYTEPVNFYVVIETTNGKTYQSDTESVREYVNRMFIQSRNVPVQGCWDRVQHTIDDMSSFRSPNQKIQITKNGNTVYFNPDHVLSITLVKLALP